MGQKLHNSIEVWKKLLLDFGKRNRLINFLEGKRNNVKITTPSFDRLWELVVISEKEIVFPYAKRVQVDEDGEEVYETVIKGDIETNKLIGDLQKTLKALRYKANTSIEEQGINTLYLTFGMLKWKERDDSSQVFASPVILVPVRLLIESITSPYRLVLHDDEIVINPTLSHKLDNDFGIIMPEFDSTNDSPAEYIEKLLHKVKNKGWDVERSTHLTNLSFLKINMYKDLERNEEKINANPVIAALVGEQDPIQVSEELNNFDHDKQIRPIDTFQVVDADSSQQDAVLLSKKGTSFVLQGPPGTGKSQTITNIIAEAIADGKKVLFVSEKMAALQVVYNRLASVGLADFCFTLHSHKAKKKDILRDLANSISIDRIRVRNEALAQLDLLERKRNLLNVYQEELHTPTSGLNISIFEVNGRLAKLENVPNVLFSIPSVAQMTETELNDRIYILKEFANISSIGNYDIANNVWGGAKVKFLSYELRQEIDSIVNNIIPTLSNIKQVLEECTNTLLLDDYKISLNGLSSIIKLLEVASKSPKTLRKWVESTCHDDILKEVHCHKTMYETLLSIKNQITKDFDKEILNIDYYSLLQRFRSDYSSLFARLGNKYRADIKYLKGFLKSGLNLKYSSALKVLNQLKAYAESLDLVLGCEELMSMQYENYFLQEYTDWSEIVKAIEYSKELNYFRTTNDIPDSLVDLICTNNEIITYCQGTLSTLTALYNTIDADLNRFLSLFEDVEGLLQLNLNDLLTRIIACRDNKHLLENWIDYKNARQACEKYGLSLFIEKIEENAVSSDLIVGAYLKRFYHLWLDTILPSFPAVQNFRGRIHNQIVNEFSELDKGQFKIAQARVKERVLSRIPDFNSLNGARDEIAILKRELNKQRRLMPLRKLFMAIPNLVTSLRPCFMMSPLSVSVFLEAQSYDFDLVIFDEASQVHTEDAIGAIMRGKQVIIVGDTKQLPPTSFFSTSLNDEDFDVDSDDVIDDNDAGAYESILDEAVSVLPERSLRWHYRSRHEHLIAFSNIKIYNSQLITFPSSIESVPDCGVEYVYVKDGIYDRGGKKNNIIEARKVADLVFEHFTKHPNRSLGVVTFSEAQQNAVDAAICQKRLENPSFDKFFIEDKEEPFFIKNLENVQGDERDTIIFSIGYARDSKGIMYMNFGPLSREGGYRRLNVAITRAKHNVKLVGSIVPTDIDLDKVSSEGVKMLRSYIEFAQQGIVALEKELTFNYDLDFDSPFEEAVYDFLQSKGYNVVTQVGCSGFRIDMAIKHPTQSGKFAIGIECDGAAYHSSRTARERDRLRQSVLEDMGWTIYRIWSTDWIKDPKKEKEKLVNAIDKVLDLAVIELEDNDVFNGRDSNADSIIPVVEIEEKIEYPEIEDKGYGFDIYERVPLKLIDASGSRREPSEVILEIVSKEQPIHFDDLCRRVAPLYGRQKATSVVQGEVGYFLLLCQMEGKIAEDWDNFVKEKDFNNIKVRIPNPDDDYLRPITHICDEELALAMKTIAQHSFGITPGDLFIVTAREFGVKRVGDNIISLLRRVYQHMLKSREVTEVDGKVQVS